MNIKVLQDYIRLEYDELETKYSESLLDEILDEIDSLVFSDSHVISEHVEQFNDDTVNPEELANDISQMLDSKGFTSAYNKRYVDAAKKTKKDDIYINLIRQVLIGDSQKNIAPRVKLQNKNINLRQLEESLSETEITLSSFTDLEKESISEQIKVFIKNLPKYEKGLTSILGAISTYTPTKYSRLSKPLTSISRIDPSKKEEREELYEYYEKLYPKYNEMKKIIKNLLDSWDRIDDDLLDNLTPNSQPNPSLEFVGELDEELKDLFDIYKKMDDNNNYIIKTDRLKYQTDNVSATAAYKEANNLLLQEISKILDKTQTKKIQTLYDKEFNYESPESRQEMLDEGMDLEEEEDPDNVVDMDAITLIDKVDPMFMIAAESGIITKRYSISSWEYIKDELQSILDSANEGTSLKSVYQSVLDSHEDYKDQAFDEMDERNDFYVPLSADASNILLSAGVDLDYDEIKELHEKLISVIARLLEVPTVPSSLPSLTTPDDFAPGATEEKGKRIIPRGEKEKAKRDEMYRQFNLFAGRETGRIGDKRDKAEFGKFAEDIMKLIEIADEYYGNPIRELMIPYKKVPIFLDKNFLGPIINHGPESLGKLSFAIYRDWSVGMITPAQINSLTSYLEYTQMTKRDSDILERRANKVLKVLQDIAPSNEENDLRWFANQFRGLAEKDTSFDISDIELLGRPIKNIPYDRKKNKTSYYQVLWLLYEFKEEFKTNRYSREAMKNFQKAYENQRDKKLASQHEMILTAHDEIRKMLGKPIYYNNCELDRFENMSDTIDLMKNKYNIDLNSNDIIKMVEEIDSFESLAKRLGTNSEVIYHVKSLYR
tara:strand:- start:5436 stop:7928 length:2493 start_codon:yes stop_codon:yes gene_type:complete